LLAINLLPEKGSNNQNINEKLKNLFKKYKTYDVLKMASGGLTVGTWRERGSSYYETGDR